MSSFAAFTCKSETIEIGNKTPPDPPADQQSVPTGIESKFSELINKYTTELRRFQTAIINFLFGAYFSWATFHIIDLKNSHFGGAETYDKNGRCEGYCGVQWCDGYGFLLILTILVYSGILLNQIGKQKLIKKFLKNIQDLSRKVPSDSLKKCLCILLPVLCAVFLYYETSDSRDRLRPLSGIVILFGIGYLFSKDSSKIRWRPVIVGFILQILLAFFCIRMEIGRKIFKCIGQKATTFLGYSKIGSHFVFGELLVRTEVVLAFAILTVIYFTSFVISILYYWGAMQWVVEKLGAPLRLALGTTVCESVATAANIFFSLSDTMLLVRPFVKFLTASEIHAIMTSSFATTAGEGLVAYVRFGAEASHLITSSVMAAPAALCFSKLFYPETEESQTSIKNCSMEKSADTSILEAASNGGNTATNIILGIIANLVAFVSFIAFANGLTNWLGYLIGMDDLSCEILIAKLFIPLSYIIGVPWEDCENIGKVIATKTIVNEFVAYQRLGELKATGQVSLRSSAIATYAICGFANPGALGILIGMITAICPEKQSVAAAVGFRAFVAGSFVNFINASIAGLLMPVSLYEELQGNNSTALSP